MRKWLLVAALAATISVTGCAGGRVPAGPAGAVAGNQPQVSVQQTLQQTDTQQTQDSALAEELSRTRQALQEAQDEIRWLHVDLGKRPGLDAPRSAVEAFANALVGRNGAMARVYLSETMRAQLHMPPHGIGLSNPHLKRYEILSERTVGDTFQFQVRFFSEYTGSPEVPEAIKTYTVQSLKDDTGNDAWLITEIAE